MGISIAEYKNLVTSKKKNKYNAKKVVIDGITFHSKKEGRHYEELKLAKKSGELDFFLMQVPFRLSGGVIYRLDFMEFWKSDLGMARKIKYVEVKGYMTKEAENKIKQTEEIYNIKIEVV